MEPGACADPVPALGILVKMPPALVHQTLAAVFFTTLWSSCRRSDFGRLAPQQQPVGYAHDGLYRRRHDVVARPPAHARGPPPPPRRLPHPPRPGGGAPARG